MVSHIPVLAKETISILQPKNGCCYVDCTFGAGGHSGLILDAASDCMLYAIDRDPLAMSFWQHPKYAKSIFIQDVFSNALKHKIKTQVDGILIDLGVSSMQLDDPNRGFSFMRNSALDMSMGSGTVSAYDIVNYESEEELARIFFYYSDERYSRRIARAIVRQREIEPIKTTFELAKIVRSAIGHHYGKIDPATKTFLAIRMKVNNELEELIGALEYGLPLLKIGGKMVIISFHSTEDKILKIAMEQINQKNTSGLLHTIPNGEFKLLKNRITPDKDEITFNPRARSAGLRVITREA